MQPGVVRSHGMGVVIEQATHNLLRDIPVDHSGPERVAPLVRRELDRVPVLVTDLAGGQPPIERKPVGRGTDRLGAVDVLRRPREQQLRVRPSCRAAAPLLTDQAA